MSTSPHSVGGGSIGAADGSAPRRKSRLSLGGFLSPLGTSQSAGSSGGGSYFSRKVRSSSGTPESSYDDLSEVSSGSSASQLRSRARSLVRGLDRMTISTRSSIVSLLDRDSSSHEPSDTMSDLLVSKATDLEIILEAALGAAEKLQVSFDKHRETIKKDKRAQSLETQNATIMTRNHQMFTTVAFCGNNGTGKSSLINALLDKECITPTSNDATCTAIPIEFKARGRGTKMPKEFTVIADIMADEEWLTLAKQILEDLEGDSSDPKYITASDILKSLFNLTVEDTPITLDEIERIPFNCKECAKFETQELLHLQDHVKKLNTYFWPVLNKITIYMDSPVLNTGVILVDLPGLGDINPMKMGVVNSYLRTSETILIVSNISQVSRDKNVIPQGPVADSIARRIKRDELVNISFVLTQADNIAADTTIANWNKKQAIQERNESKIHQIKSLPQSRSNSEVFCVSSLEYQWNHKRLKDPNTTPCLRVEDTGVPSLRRFIQQRGLYQRELAVKSLVQGEMMSFWNSLQHWCNTSLEQQEAMVLEEQARLLLNRAESFRKLKESIPEKIVQPLLRPLNTFITVLAAEGNIDEEFISGAANEAEAYGRKAWGKLKYNQVTALCTRNGCGELKIGDQKVFVDLNRYFAIPFTNGFSRLWGLHLGAHPIPQMFGVIKNSLRNSISDSLKDIVPVEKLEPILNQVDSAVGELEDGWQLNLGTIDVIIEEVEVQNKIKAKLSALYAICKAQKDSGATKRRTQILERDLFGLLYSQYMEICDEVFMMLNGLSGAETRMTMCPLEPTGLIGSTKVFLTRELTRILSIPEATYASPVEIDMVDLSSIKAEILGLGKFMMALEHQASRPRTTEVSL